VGETAETESQRIQEIAGERTEVDFNEDLVKPGAAEMYEARCLGFWKLPGEPELKYQLPLLRKN